MKTLEELFPAADNTGMYTAEQTLKLARVVAALIAEGNTAQEVRGWLLAKTVAAGIDVSELGGAAYIGEFHGAQRTLVSTIVSAAAEIHDGRTPLRILAHCTAELGELAEEVVIAEQDSHKVAGPDGVVGEAVDTIICLLDLIYTKHPEVREGDLIQIAEAKLRKWKQNVDYVLRERRGQPE